MLPYTIDVVLDPLYHKLNKSLNCITPIDAYCSTISIGSIEIPVVTLTSTGIQKEGNRLKGIFATPEIAIEYFEQEFYKYAEGKGNTIYWRRKPTLKCVPLEEWNYNIDRLGTVNYYTVVCRLLITDMEDNTSEIKRLNKNP
jgi:hypothetical protein